MKVKRVMAMLMSLLVVCTVTACQTEEEEMSNFVEIVLAESGEAAGGSIVAELFPDKAPETVENFKTLVADGFYDGLTFHRIVEDFVVQGGDPDGTGTGGPGHNIKGEFANNGFTQNDLTHVDGALAMARANHPDSAGSQFYITLGAQPFLDGNYAVFGVVVEGLEVVHQLADDFLSGKYTSNPVMESVKFVER